MRVTRFGPMGASVVVLDDEGRTGDLHVVEEKKCVVKLANNIHTCTPIHSMYIYAYIINLYYLYAMHYCFHVVIAVVFV